MKKVKIIFLICQIILLSFILNGCWDLREINELGLVTAVGIDKCDGHNKYCITVQIANSTNQSSDDSKSATRSESWIGSARGSSLFEAIRRLVEISSRRIMWAHNSVIIIGESMARDGIIPIVDYFTHNPELRMKTVVLISSGNAKDYLTTKAGMETPSGTSFYLFEGYRGLSAETVRSHMLEISSSLKDGYSNPIIAKVSLIDALSQGDDVTNSGKKIKTVSMSGSAVFNNDKMLGWISPQESRGVSWILNQTDSIVVPVTDPKHSNNSVSVETNNVKADLKVTVINGIPRINITIKGEGEIAEEDDNTSQNMSEMKKNIANLVNKQIEFEVNSALNIIQHKYMVDCLGFAQVVHVQNDKAWESRLKYIWKDLFPNVPVTVTANITIKSSKLNQEPMKVY